MLTSTDVDLLSSTLTPNELTTLIDALWKLTTAADGQLSNTHDVRQRVWEILMPTLIPLRRQRREDEIQQQKQVIIDQLKHNKSEGVAPLPTTNGSTSAASTLSKEWSLSELGALAKGTAKYPGGVTKSVTDRT